MTKGGEYKMTIKQEKEAYKIYKAKVQENLGITDSTFQIFRRYGKKLNKIYCDACNGDISDKEYNDKTEQIYYNTNSIAQALELYIYYQTDPRGATIYLDRKPIPENNYNIAQCIY